MLIRIDLENALRSRSLTPRQRQVVALYYFAQLTGGQTAQVLGITRQAVDAIRKRAVEAIAAHMTGEPAQASQLIAWDSEIGAEETPLAKWARWAAENREEWWRVLPAGATDEMNARFPFDDGRVSDELPGGACCEKEGEEYPYLDAWEMHYRARQREKSFDNVYPDARFAGRRVNPDDGRKVPLPRIA